MAGEVREGDRVLLLDPQSGRRWLVRCRGGMRKEKGLGVFDAARLAGQAYGATVRVAATRLVVLRPRTPDLVATLRRKAQIITPKDAARIVHGLGVQPGDRILEAGVGSGAATAVLAAAVGHGGRVVAQEIRQDFAEWAGANMEDAGLADRVEIHVGDLTEGPVAAVAESAPFDALLLDLPEPWRALPRVWTLLAPGARAACYCPQVSQMEQAVRALEALGAAEVEALEIIERHWVVKDLGSRPSFEGLGHTGFLVFGRRVPGPAGA